VMHYIFKFMIIASVENVHSKRFFMRNRIEFNIKCWGEALEYKKIK